MSIDKRSSAGRQPAQQKRFMRTAVASVLAMASVAGFCAGPAAAADIFAKADFNGDTVLDECSSSSELTGTGQCKVSGASNLPYRSEPMDMGWHDGRAWVDHNGDGRDDYCRAVGSNQLACTVSVAPSDPRATYFQGFGQTYYSAPLDHGWTDSRTWRDVNVDGKADYCTAVGWPNSQLTCTISNGEGFAAPTNNVYCPSGVAGPMCSTSTGSGGSGTGGSGGSGTRTMEN